MSFYRGMSCKNVTLTGDGGTRITAYGATPALGRTTLDRERPKCGRVADRLLML